MDAELITDAHRSALLAEFRTEPSTILAKQRALTSVEAWHGMSPLMKGKRSQRAIIDPSGSPRASRHTPSL
jgi:hypothetical protein